MGVGKVSRSGSYIPDAVPENYLYGIYGIINL